MIEPNTHGKTMPQLEAMLRDAKSAVRLIEASMVPGCVHCEHRNGNDVELCLKYNIKPPPDVQKSGCESWIYDDIPF